ncbi:hypothetical protein ACIQVL_22300 [Streptomyces sp. NPDC090499]
MTSILRMSLTHDQHVHAGGGAGTFIEHLAVALSDLSAFEVEEVE